MSEDSRPVPDDGFMIRCRKLGHQINFPYCRRENEGAPCARALDCWYPYFPVERFFREKLSPDAFAAAFEAPAKPKVLSLVELIERAQKKTSK